jgi:N-acetylmuramoyl-L-alanine amidase
MSANPTRVDCEAPPVPLLQGNRVLESIARQDPLGSLLAFSELHEQLRNRQLASGNAADGDWSETERFILDEVLQLISDRAQTLSQADGIVVALKKETKPEDSKPEASRAASPELVFRATSGPLAIERGVHLLGDSAFLRECLESGRILRCDDCDTDARVKLDFARQLRARSTVVVPLRGRREQLGVLQAFSTKAQAFTEDDVRCFDLFAELVLSALKPVDQDRRINWLSDVADEVLRPERVAAKPQVAELPAIETQPIEPVKTSVEKKLAPSPIPAAAPIPDPRPTPPAANLAAAPAQPVVVPAATVELPELAAQHNSLEPDEILAPVETRRVQSLVLVPRAWPILAPKPQPLPFLHRLSLAGSSRPGLSVVVGLVVVAALFSAGAWWGMQVHGKISVAGTEATSIAANRTAANQIATARTAPAPPSDVLTPAVSDNLMNPAAAGSDSAPLTAVAEGKLAALPKVTGVRHWSSSSGSTVVIDMDDQVPYEVHRLMSPERIYFDLHDTVLARDLDGKSMDVGDTSLTRVRIAQPVAGVTRVVLDTKDGSNFSVSMESSPYRLVVELRGSDKALAAKTPARDLIAKNVTTILANATPNPANLAPAAALATQTSVQPVPAKTGKFRIVLDAGHGGWDLGTVGRQGLLEKDLVLDVTQRLGKLLQARLGADVLFTRANDTYLPLDQRADFANHSQADLFVSVHANYSSSATARGVETYYTNQFFAPGSREGSSREVEKRDDETAAKLMPVSLSAGGLHDKTEESRRLAASVQHSLYATLAASSPDIRNRGTKASAFAVLTGATMPAILTEISFVSSPADEQKLQSATYRQQIAEALYKGIAGYEQSSPHAKVAQLR